MKKNLIEISERDFLSLPDIEAEKAFNSLAIEEQITVVLKSAWEERQKLILLSENAPAIVRNMPVEEFYWTVKASGPADSLPLLSMAEPPQLQFIFDMDWWKKDSLEPGRVISWLIMITEAGDENFRQWISWIRNKDDLIPPAILYPFIHVYKRPDDMEIEEAKDLLPAFTLDNNYFIAFKSDKLRPLLEIFINRLLEHSDGLYRDTMETILDMTASHITELSFRRRCGRLNDAGIPDYYEAISIYAPLTPEDTVKDHPINPDSLTGIDNMVMPAFVPTLYMAEYPVLQEAVGGIAGTPVMERIIMEWVGVANKLLIAEHLDFDDPEVLKRGLGATSALLNAGLDILIHTYGGHPASHLGSVALEDLVRLANTGMKRLAQKAKGIFTPKWTLRYMPSSWQDRLSWLMNEPPMVWDSKLMTPAHVSSVKELQELEVLIEEAEKWLIILERITPPCSSWERTIDWGATNFLNDAGFTWDAALSTVFLNCITGEGPFMLPLAEKQVKDAARMLALTLDTGNGEDHVRDVFDACMEDILAGTPLSADDISLIFHKAVAPFIHEIKEISERRNTEEATEKDFLYSKNILIETADKKQGDIFQE